VDYLDDRNCGHKRLVGTYFCGDIFSSFLSRFVSTLPKPSRRHGKGMHWDTFERLTAQHDAFVQITFAGMEAKLGWVDEILTKWS